MRKEEREVAREWKGGRLERRVRRKGREVAREGKGRVCWPEGSRVKRRQECGKVEVVEA